MLLWACIGLNVGIFAAWQYAVAGNSSQKWRIRNYLEKNFVLHTNDVSSGRYWTMLTSAFSHMQPYHILGNMFSLYAFGSVLLSRGIPVQHLGALLAGSAFSGSAGYIYNESQKRSRRSRSALGASGMVMGVGSAAALLAPSTKMLLFGIVPVPLWALIAGYFATDAYYLDAQDARIAHAGHLGGLVFGMAYYALRLRRFGGLLGRFR